MSIAPLVLLAPVQNGSSFARTDADFAPQPPGTELLSSVSAEVVTDDFEARYESVVTTPYHGLVDPKLVVEAYRDALDECMCAAAT